MSTVEAHGDTRAAAPAGARDGLAGGCRASRRGAHPPPRPRRPARPGHRRRARLPPRRHLAAGWLPRRRRVLRRVGLPHHHAPGPRAVTHRHDRPAGVLDPARPPAAARAAAVRPGIRAARPAQRGRPARRDRAAGDRGRDLHVELARDRGRLRLLRRDVTAAVHEPLVARGRGAVLPRVAARRARARPRRATPGGPGRGGARPRAAVGGAHGRPPRPREPHPRLLRHRHPRHGTHAGRRPRLRLVRPAPRLDDRRRGGPPSADGWPAPRS